MTTRRITLDHNALRAVLWRTGACQEARSWASKMDLRQAWTSCDRGDWMMWLAARLGVDRKTVVIAACQCARTALVYVPAGEDRPRKAIETTEAWCRGEATIEQVRAAADAADDAYAAYVCAAYACAHAANRQCAAAVREAIPYRTIAAAAQRMLKNERKDQ